MMFESVTDLPRAWGEPLASASLKSQPSDFIVREVIDFPLDGEGEHLYLYIRKCQLNTNDVLDVLQKQFNCGSVDIGVSGMKDKVALTDQWFSVRTPIELDQTTLKSTDSGNVIAEGELCVLESTRHTRKLRRGAHRHNYFKITLRNLSANDSTDVRDAIDQRLQTISSHGFVNYFGPQRFGIGQQNLVKAERFFASPKRKISRVQRGILISSARSLLFNRVCAERVANANWNVPMIGEPMLLDGSHSFFIHDADATDTQSRCSAGDVHPTGPLWGEGDELAVAQCAEFENKVLSDYSSFSVGLEKAGLKQQRRALRASVEQLQWQWTDPDVLTLEFNLQKGVYATSFLSEVVNYS